MNSKQAKIGGAAAILLALAACSDGEEDSEGYPDGAVTIVVPVPAGSSTDLSTRILAPCLEDELGQTVLVENHEGGSGAVGNTYFTQADPDGYTLVSTTAANAVLPPLLEDGVQFDADSFLPLGTIGQAPIVMVVSDDSPYETADEFLAADTVVAVVVPEQRAEVTEQQRERPAAESREVRDQTASERPLSDP
jgi:tripartite-type tricarboxylate transporter receptor subunit TctC